MGGSWDGVNDCWEYCFGRETQVVDQLVNIVNANNFDGVDIDYEYYYENNQHGSSFSKGAESIKFLTDVTVGLRNRLPSNALITHAPMDADLVEGTPYFNMIKSISHTLDFLMPQYYNGYTRAALDGFSNSGSGQMASSVHYQSLLDNMFNGDATRVVFGFCINDCGGTGSNANGAQAATVMSQIGNIYDCHGGAFFWVAADDTGGGWSSTVNTAMDSTRGCSSGTIPKVTTAPTDAPSVDKSKTESPSVDSSPTVAPTESGAEITCCPEGKALFRAYGEDCSRFFYCLNGKAVDEPIPCPAGLIFNEAAQSCGWPALTVCDPQCGITQVKTPSPTPSPTKDSSTPSPTEDRSTQSPTRDNDELTPPPTEDKSTPSPTKDNDELTPAPTKDRSTPSPTEDSSTPSPTKDSSTPSPTKGNDELTPAPTENKKPTEVPSAAPEEKCCPMGEQCCPAGESSFYRAFGSDCQKFYKCSNGKPSSVIACADGLIYDELAQTCNWPSATVCKNRCKDEDGGDNDKEPDPTDPPKDPREENPGEGCGAANLCTGTSSQWAIHRTGLLGRCSDRCVDDAGVKSLTSSGSLRSYKCGACPKESDAPTSFLARLFQLFFGRG